MNKKARSELYDDAYQAIRVKPFLKPGEETLPPIWRQIRATFNAMQQQNMIVTGLVGDIIDSEEGI